MIKWFDAQKTLPDRSTRYPDMSVNVQFKTSYQIHIGYVMFYGGEITWISNMRDNPIPHADVLSWTYDPVVR
jgi:hypothetical protein